MPRGVKGSGKPRLPKTTNKVTGVTLVNGVPVEKVVKPRRGRKPRAVNTNTTKAPRTSGGSRRDIFGAHSLQIKSMECKSKMISIVRSTLDSMYSAFEAADIERAIYQPLMDKFTKAGVDALLNDKLSAPPKSVKPDAIDKAIASV